MEEVLTKKEWNDFIISGTGNSFLQSWEWGEFQAALGVPFWRIGVGEHESTKAAALVLKRDLPGGRSWLYVPRGPVTADYRSVMADWKDIQGPLLERARAEQALFVRTEPALPSTHIAALKGTGWFKADHDVQPRHTLVLDLNKTEDHLKAQMHQKTRYNIRLAERKGVTVRFSCEPKDMELFLQLSQDVADRSVFRYHPADYYRAMCRVLGRSGLLEIAVAEYEGAPLAVHLLISFGGITTYAHGASSSSHRALMGPHLLQWQSILRAKEKGDHTYDFFGIAPQEAVISPATGESHPWSGITRFKLGFGGHRVAYLGAYDYILQSGLYSVFTMVRRLRSMWR